MASITTRETSALESDRTGITNANAPLTNAQIDANFIALNNDKLEISDGAEAATPSTVVKRTSTGGINVVGLDASGPVSALSLILDNPLLISEGGTGSTTAAGARNNLGLDTDDDVRFDSLGVGTAASGVTGEIRALKTITAWYSDERLKENIELIPNALDKVETLRGVSFNANDIAESYGYSKEEKHVGVIAQDVKEVLPEAVKPAPFDRQIFEGTEYSKSGQEYMTVQYEKLVPLLIEAVKELSAKVKELESR
jgi:hypothetical protein